MDSPTLSMAGFELVNSPSNIRTPCINLGEFEEDASPLQQTFCNNLMSEEQYQAEAVTETEKALKDLIEHLENDQTAMLKILQRRKQEEIEHSGFVSLLKARLMKKVQGERYNKKLVSVEECKTKVEEVTQGMMMVFNYAQESKGSRFSKRLAVKRGFQVYEDSTPLRSLPSPKRRTKGKENTSKKHKIPAPPPLPGNLCSAKSNYPPPPPVPPPVLTPLKDRNIMLNSPTVEELKRPPIRNGSTGSLVSVHEELLASNPLQRLRSVKQVRSPGGTPVKKPYCLNSSRGSIDMSTPAGLKNQEPLAQIFFRILEQKFHNIRSPSPAPSPSNNSALSPGDFTP